MDVYMRLPEYRMGSSFDYKIVSEGEPGLLEIKNVDWVAYTKITGSSIHQIR